MFELFTKSGLAGYPLGLCSILVLAVILERWYTLDVLQKLEARAFSHLYQALQRGRGVRLSDPEVANAPVSVVLESLSEMDGASADAILQAAELALSTQRLRLRRYLPTLATIGSTAPYIGLFGTVLGVMSAFRAMSMSSLSGEAMAGGISEALSATALGLLVAIPAVIAYNFYLGRTGGLYLQIQEHVAKLLPLIYVPDRQEQVV
jgi:biopolymer transport protein ExbB/TolQ